MLSQWQMEVPNYNLGLYVIFKPNFLIFCQPNFLANLDKLNLHLASYFINQIDMVVFLVLSYKLTEKFKFSRI